MAQKNTVYASIVLVSVFLGLMLAVQFRIVNNPNGIFTRTEEAYAELINLNQEKDDLKKEIADLEDAISQANNNSKSGKINAINDELNKVQMSAGLVTVSGQGVEIVWDKSEDSNDQLMGDYNEIDYLGFFAYEMLEVVNELWGSGAEAISINGHRIISTSEIRFVDPFININTKRVVPPYQVLAIGNADNMKNNLELLGKVEFLKNIGYEVTIEKHDDLTIPAYTER